MRYEQKTVEMPMPKLVNQFLLTYQIFIKDNPAVSPDLTLDFPGLLRELDQDASVVDGLGDPERAARAGTVVTLYPSSAFSLGGAPLFVVESRRTGDCALITNHEGALPFVAVSGVRRARVVPLAWENLIRLKNAVLEHDPDSTIFPRAAGTLAKTSLGIGARFTTLHWPAVAWTMKQLRLSVTANQNSIPRELVFDTEVMLAGALSEVPFPFIGGSVPEGHQGQSVQGMSHAAIITYLKYGFHRHGIPWGFNADHQPIGGRFDAIEGKLVEGSLFASYITYDLSPELALAQPISAPSEVERRFAATVSPELARAVQGRLSGLGLAPEPTELKRLVLYLMPAMQKMQRRDAAYVKIREERFTSPAGRAFFRELSIDELPGQTTPETLAVCLAMAEALGVTFNFVAPNIGFQKNFPYPDNRELHAKVGTLYEIARKFGVSFGFHSGSGKSAENYRVLGEVTGRNLEIKTSGRYTYEMGAALSRSSDAEDQALWRDWYGFTRDLACEGAFSENATRRQLAREFIAHALQIEGRPAAGAFDSPQALRQTLASLPPSPDHMFWFEYNFLYVLAAEGSTRRLGDHGQAGYEQRRRFYRISDEGRLRFAKNVAGYILFLAETTGVSPPAKVAQARGRLAGYGSNAELLADIA